MTLITGKLNNYKSHGSKNDGPGAPGNGSNQSDGSIRHGSPHIGKLKRQRTQRSYLEKQGCFLEKQASYLEKQASYLEKQGCYLEKQGSYLARPGSHFERQGSSWESAGLLTLMKSSLQPIFAAGSARLPSVLLGLCFLVVFSGFSTLSNLQKTILASVRDEQPEFRGDGYISLGILYSAYAVSLWLTPSVISVTGPVVAMVIGAAGYVLFPTFFILESTVALYIGAFINGIGSALLWNGQANYLILVSNPGQVSKNVGLFWAIYTVGMIPGNLLVFFAFKDKQKHIDSSTRVFILTALSLVMALGALLMFFLRRPVRPCSPVNSAVDESAVVVPDEVVRKSPVEAFRTALSLSVTRPMLWLMVPFCYAGLQLSFSSSVYSASVGFTLQMGRSTKQLVPLAGILTGLGEISGGTLPFVFHNRKLGGLSLIMLTGLVANIVSYALVYVNIPDEAPFGNTWEMSLIPPNAYLAVFCSFLMGVGDCCIHNELYSILGALYPNDSAEVFAAFKCVRCICTAAIFYCSTVIGLHAQLTVQALVLALCALCYANVQLNILNRKSSDEITTPLDERMAKVDGNLSKTSALEQPVEGPLDDQLTDGSVIEPLNQIEDKLSEQSKHKSVSDDRPSADCSTEPVIEPLEDINKAKDHDNNPNGHTNQTKKTLEHFENIDDRLLNILNKPLQLERVHGSAETIEDNLETKENQVIDGENEREAKTKHSTNDENVEFDFENFQANNLHIENFICK